MLLDALQLVFDEKTSGQTYKSGPVDKDFAGYLFTYFKGNAVKEEASFAISSDGYNYRALNNNEPVITSKLVERDQLN